MNQDTILKDEDISAEKDEILTEEDILEEDVLTDEETDEDILTEEDLMDEDEEMDEDILTEEDLMEEGSIQSYVDPRNSGYGTLSIVSTPIGNWDDITLRAVETLKKAEFVICEEAKEGAKLLKQYRIKKHMEILNEHNEAENCDEIIKKMKGGADAALISDAGTPLMADPGSILVKQCIQLGINVEIIPGVTSIVTALTRSCLDLEKFYFAGFLSRKPEEREMELMELAKFPYTIVLLETPYRLMPFLTAAAKTMPHRKAYIGCNLTMPFETHHYGTFKELYDKFDESRFKGEFVICFEGAAGSKTIAQRVVERNYNREDAERLSRNFNNYDRSADRGRGDRRSSGDRDRRDSGERRPYGDRKPFGDRDSRDSGERRPFGDRGGFTSRFEKRERTDGTDRLERRGSSAGKPFGDRRPFGDRDNRDSGERRPYGDRAPIERRPYGDRDSSERRPYGDRDNRDSSERRPYGERDNRDSSERRPYGDRDSRDSGERRPYGDRKPFGDRDIRDSGERKPFGDRKTFGDRDRRDFSDRRDSGDSYERRDRSDDRESGEGFGGEKKYVKPNFNDTRAPRKPFKKEGDRKKFNKKSSGFSSPRKRK